MKQNDEGLGPCECPLRGLIWIRLLCRFFLQNVYAVYVISFRLLIYGH